jgi:hypothetical protein
MLYSINGQFGKTIADVRAAYPDVSFPEGVAFTHEGAFAYSASPVPAFDPLTQKVVEANPVDGAQQWAVVALSGEDAQAAAQSAAEEARAQAKAAREAAVAAIKVTTQSGKEFDGDEVSQGRMARAIIGLQAANAPSITWVLADNTPATVTLAELTEALVLAGQAQAAIWVV